jgi:hypothetical protein
VADLELQVRVLMVETQTAIMLELAAAAQLGVAELLISMDRLR